MKWNLHPASLLKSIAASVSVFTMCIAPVAQGAAAASNKQLINQYLKETGISTKKMTVGQYWASVRHVYPAKLQKQLDGWVALNKNQMMPKVEATTFKGADGVEQVRLTLSRDGQTYNITFTGNEDTPVKVNSITLNKKEMANYNNYDAVAKKIVEKDPALKKVYGTVGSVNSSQLSKPKVSSAIFKKMSRRQQAEYLIRLRLAMESAQKVLAVSNNTQATIETEKKYEFALQSMFGDLAYAGQLTGQPCIIAGYISKYGADNSCGSTRKGGALNEDLLGQMRTSKANCGGGVACNPLVYGYKNGNAFCVPKEEVQYATRYCGSEKASPLRKGKAEFNSDKKRIIESYLKENGTEENKNISLDIDSDGFVSEEQNKQAEPFMRDLRNYLLKADSECSKPPLKQVTEKRDEQASACNELRERMISLGIQERKPDPPLPPLPLPNPPTKSCEEEKPGSARDAEGKCTCAATGNPESREEGGKCVIPAVVVVAEDGGNLPQGEAPQKEKEKDDCRSKGGSFWECNSAWIIPLGLLAFGAGLFWWIKDRNKTPGAYVPPAPVPEPSPSPTATTPPVTPPPTAPCPSPNTWVNGVCTPPSVVPPPAITSEGGNKVETPGRVNGVR